MRICNTYGIFDLIRNVFNTYIVFNLFLLFRIRLTLLQICLYSYTVSFADLNQGSKTIVYKSILTSVEAEASYIFGGCWEVAVIGSSLHLNHHREI